MRPVLFWLRGLPVYSYAVFTGFGLLVGFLRAYKEMARRELPRSLLWRLVPAVGALSLIGGRFLHIAFNWRQFSGNWRLLLTRWRPGLSFHGVMLGSIAGAGWVAHRSGVPFSRLLDVLAPAAAEGHAIGRIGCFINGCCYGKRTRLPWGVSFANPKICPDTMPRHPTQLYEAAGLLILSTRIAQQGRAQRYSGEQFVSWMVGYALIRIWNDLFRDGLQTTASGLTYSQWFSAVLLATGAAYHHRRTREPKT